MTALNTGAMSIDSVIYNYYSYAYVFGGLVVRIISGAATAVLMVFVAPPVVNLLNRSLDTQCARRNKMLFKEGRG